MPRRLPGLDFIRFYAAMSVVLAHAIFYRGCSSHSACGFSVELLTLTAHDAVTLFFVLSGFLITYLLLVERQEQGEISAAYFYARRSLRIFPLYYLVIVISALLAPTNMPQLASSYVAIALVSPHLVAYDLYILIHLWSIGVEEWFYVTWAVVIKRGWLLKISIVIVAVRLALVALIPELGSYSAYYTTDYWINLILALRVEAMAVGALGAWIYMEQHWTLRIVYRLQPLCIGLLVLVVIFPFTGGIPYNVALAFVFMGFILNVSTNPRTLLKLEHPLVRKLGQVSYGIYMYHLLVIDVVGAFARQIGAGDAVYLVGVVVVDIGVALLSYRFFETPFLKRKPYRQLENTQPIQHGLQE